MQTEKISNLEIGIESSLVPKEYRTCALHILNKPYLGQIHYGPHTLASTTVLHVSTRRSRILDKRVGGWGEYDNHMRRDGAQTRRGWQQGMFDVHCQLP